VSPELVLLRRVLLRCLLPLAYAQVLLELVP
jgi:hypothetical protein